MQVFITGGGGFLGQRLARSLLTRGTLNGAPIQTITCFDQAYPAHTDARLACIRGDAADPAAVKAAMPTGTGAVFHLAAVVSAGAEADFDGGYRVNLDGTRAVLEACRALAQPPRVVFASSVAAFGGDMPEVIDDRTVANPQSSYGTQKVIGERLVCDYNRKGYIDGRALRLPTIVVRPGKPNLAASSFASGIIREPIAGETSILPVPSSTGVWILSPDGAITAFTRAMELAPEIWGIDRVLNLPGITITVDQMLAELAAIAGQEVAARVIPRIDPSIARIVATWPTKFRTDRANQLGFTADLDMSSIIRAHIRDSST
jgi:D-erythronate 2-dehydrogenase